MMCQQLSPVLPATGIAAHARSRPRSRLNRSWITAGLGVVIVLLSVALMAVSAPARPAPVRPAPAPHGLIHLERDAGPIPAPASGTQHRPGR